MRILHLVTRGFGGGSERAIQAAIHKEIEWGHEVSLASGNSDFVEHGFTSFPRLFVENLVRDIHPIKDFRAVLNTRALIRQARPDVLHTHESKAGVIGRLAAVGTKTAVIHTVHMASFGSGYGRASSLVYQWVERMVGPLTDVLIFVGGDLRRQFQDAGIAPRGIQAVVPSRINLSEFELTPNERELQRAQMRATLNVKSNQKLLLNIGLLEPRKRQGFLIQAIAGAIKSNDWRLLLVGIGPDENNIRKLVSELDLEGHVHLLGFRKDIPALMAAADVLVHASLSEGVAQVMVQAAAMGLPIVATNVQGVGDVSHVRVVAQDGLELPAALTELLMNAEPGDQVSDLSAWHPSHIDAAHLDTLAYAEQTVRSLKNSRTVANPKRD